LKHASGHGLSILQVIGELVPLSVIHALLVGVNLWQNDVWNLFDWREQALAVWLPSRLNIHLLSP
jgi:hypothetical protein